MGGPQAETLIRRCGVVDVLGQEQVEDILKRNNTASTLSTSGFNESTIGTLGSGVLGSFATGSTGIGTGSFNSAGGGGGSGSAPFGNNTLYNRADNSTNFGSLKKEDLRNSFSRASNER